MDTSLSVSVEISISCRDLLDKDVLSKSDPFVVVREKSLMGDKFIEKGRTEVIKNNLNPEFVKKIVIEYHFEERQILEFAVYDCDSSSSDIRDHDFLGICDVKLGELVSSVRLTKNLKNSQMEKAGTITFFTEEIATCLDEIVLRLGGKDLDKKDFFGSSDPYLDIYRMNEDQSRTVVHRTEVVKHNLNPTWKPIRLSIQALSNGDQHRTLVVVCNDWNKNGNSFSADLIGEVSTSVHDLAQRYENGDRSLELINPEKKRRKKNYKNSGFLCLGLVQIERKHSFLEYIQGGTTLHCCIAIDFTASNGDPNLQSSLHFCSPSVPTQYAIALQAVGEIISDYDSNKMFPAFGFGARLPPSNVVSHCFPLNGCDTNPYCDGIHGVVDTYYRCLQCVKLAGPTNFSPIIDAVANIASRTKDGSEYYILLMLTDGMISDLQKTIEVIVNASALPLSIIIVGIGNGDFDGMETLDGDDVRLSVNGRRAVRDIVQFVPFRKMYDGNSIQASKCRLSKSVLAEVPSQLLSYMELNCIKPKVPPGSNRSLYPLDAVKA